MKYTGPEDKRSENIFIAGSDMSGCLDEFAIERMDYGVKYIRGDGLVQVRLAYDRSSQDLGLLEFDVEGNPTDVILIRKRLEGLYKNLGFSIL